MSQWVNGSVDGSMGRMGPGSMGQWVNGSNGSWVTNGDPWSTLVGTILVIIIVETRDVKCNATLLYFQENIYPSEYM